RLTFLELHVTPSSLVIGYGASIAVSLLTIWWAVRALGKVSSRSLLSGETSETGAGTPAASRRWSVRIAVGAAAGAVACLAAAPFVPGHELQAMTFFTRGALLLTAGVWGVSVWMGRP